VKRNESMSDAARRELREEAGVVVGEADDAMELFGLYVSYRDFNSNHIAVFLVREWTRVESHDREIANSGFFAPDALPAPMSGATIRRLDECLGRRPATGAW
jgi:8-oxo-dGTP pyrophosphatase MutT (NUDIX family)